GLLARMLDAHKRQVQPANPELPMFASLRGTPLGLQGLERRILRPILGSEWRGWHALRRGVASTLHALGVDDLTIQRVLRHASVQTTQTHYIKSAPEAAVAAMAKLETSALQSSQGLLDRAWTGPEGSKRVN
ncbi:MAG TPA: hypothetical protein VLC12_09155, partial [Terriglobales bacterium]|nr:hypothetical protein [Terriglobales bacterium]